MAKGPEQKLYKPITKELTKRGCYVWKVHGSAFGTSRPDFVVWRGDGIVFALEVKTPDNPEPTPLQQHELDLLARQGILVAVIYSVAQAIAVYDLAGQYALLRKARHAQM